MPKPCNPYERVPFKPILHWWFNNGLIKNYNNKKKANTVLKCKATKDMHLGLP